MGAATGSLVPEPNPSVPEPPTKTDTAAHDDRIRAYLAFYVFTGFLAFVFWVSTHPVQLPGDTLGIILGAFITLTGTVVGYYYTSSSGSTAKQASLEKKGVI